MFKKIFNIIRTNIKNLNINIGLINMERNNKSENEKISKLEKENKEIKEEKEILKKAIGIISKQN